MQLIELLLSVAGLLITFLLGILGFWIQKWIRSTDALTQAPNNLKIRFAGTKLSPVDKAPANHESLPELRPYAKRNEDISGRTIPGTIFLAELDTTHPMAYCYHSDKLAIFKESASFYKPGQDVYENPAVFSDNPLLSGYVNKANLALLKSSSAVQRQSLGNGKVILFLDDPLFRGYWAGMHKLFLNSLFWGKL